MASGARAAADVVADAAGVAAAWKTVLPDRSPTNSDRHRRRKQASAVADFDGGSPEPAPSLVEPEPVVPQPQPQPEERAQPETVGASGETEAAQEAERAAARRRSTVREKVSFFTSPQPEAAPTPAPLAHSQPEPAPPRRSGRARGGGSEPNATTQGRMVVAALWRRRITIAFNKKPPGQNRAVFRWADAIELSYLGMIFSEERRLPRITRGTSFFRIMP